MKLLVVSGSRADWGMLEWPIKVLREDKFFDVRVVKLWNVGFAQAFRDAGARMEDEKPDRILILGDRFEILAVATAAHLKRVPIAHIAGGDVTEGSYDDAMRDCISRMADMHFVTSTSAMARLTHLGCKNVHLVGSPGIDYIRHADWKRERPITNPYVVVAYYPETIDGTVDIAAVDAAIAGRKAVWISANPDAGSERIPNGQTYPHDEFLNLIYHCEEFIGNSSAMLYEAPELGIKTRMIGKRQRGRTIPMGDGLASQRIANTLKYT